MRLVTKTTAPATEERSGRVAGAREWVCVRLTDRLCCLLRVNQRAALADLSDPRPCNNWLRWCEVRAAGRGWLLADKRAPCSVRYAGGRCTCSAIDARGEEE